MKVFLTGGSGMVGRNLREHPDSYEHLILAPSHAELNLLDEGQVFDYIKYHKPDVIIHAAGTVGGIQANIARPVAFLSDNMKIGMNVILGGHRASVKYVLNIGSSCMYPRNAVNPLAEDQILKGELEPTNEGYALAKISCARLCDYISRENPDSVYRTVIPCNLFGRHDKFDPQKSHMIPAVIAKIHDAVHMGRASIDIWGDGLARREFMYAGDLADFIFFALPQLERLPQYLNIGLGYDYSVNEYYNIISKVLGYSGDFSHDLSKPAGMAQKLVDINRLKNLGWVAKTSLPNGIEKTYSYYLMEKQNDQS